MTEAEAMQRLRATVDRYGTAKAMAAAMGVSPQYLSAVLAGRTSPKGVLERFGLVQVISYEWAAGGGG